MPTHEINKAEKKIRIDYIQTHRKEVNLKKACMNAGIDYKQLIAGVNGDYNRVSVKFLDKFIVAMNDAINEMATNEQNKKLVMIYKHYLQHKMATTTYEKKQSLLKLLSYITKYGEELPREELEYMAYDIKQGGK